MYVNVTNMKTQLNRIIASLNTLYEDYLNYYNELNGVILYWQDPIATRYFDSVKKEQVKVQNMQEEFTFLKEVYQYFVNKYSELGNKIFYVLENKNACISRTNNFIEKAKNVVRSYEKLDTGFCSSERGILEREKEKLKQIIEDMEQEKEVLRTTFQKIEEIENQIQAKLSRINVEIIKETDLVGFLR